MVGYYRNFGRVWLSAEFYTPLHDKDYGWLYHVHILPFMTFTGNYNKSLRFGWLFAECEVQLERGGKENAPKGDGDV